MGRQNRTIRNVTIPESDIFVNPITTGELSTNNDWVVQFVTLQIIFEDNAVSLIRAVQTRREALPAVGTVH